MGADAFAGSATGRMPGDHDKSELDIGCEHRLEQCMTARKKHSRRSRRVSDFSAFDNACARWSRSRWPASPGGWCALTHPAGECRLPANDRAAVPHRSANHTLIDAQAVGFNRDITY